MAPPLPSEVCAAYGREDGVYVLSTGGGNLLISRLNLSSGVVVVSHPIPDTPWIQSDTSKSVGVVSVGVA